MSIYSTSKQFYEEPMTAKEYEEEMKAEYESKRYDKLKEMLFDWRNDDMDMKLFREAMIVGNLFWKRYGHDERTHEWKGGEECCLFCKTIIKKAKENKNSIEDTFNEYVEELITEINNIETELPCHMWDELCKGFLAGEILGEPTDENLKKVKKAEKLWEDTDTYGYYQEVLNEVA